MKECGDVVRLGAQRLLAEVTSSSKIAALLERVSSHYLDAESKRYLCLILRDFCRAGAYLSEDDRRELRQFDLKLADLSHEYLLLDEESDLWIDPKHLQHMLQDFQDSHKVDAVFGTVKLSVTDDYNDLAEYCNDDEILKELYKIRENRAPKNEEELKTMIELRNRKVQIFHSVRYPSFLHYAAEPDMMSCPDTVRSFLVDLNDRARSSADDEKRVLSAILEEEKRHLNEWNLDYAKRQLWNARI